MDQNISKTNLLKRSIQLFGGPNSLLLSLRESGNQGYFRLAIDNGLIYVSDSLTNMFGYASNEEMMNCDLRQLYDRNSDHDVIMDKLQKELLVEEMVLYRRKEGAAFWGLFRGMLRKLRNESYFDGLITNIDLSVQRQRLFFKNDSAVEKLSAELDRFIYSASHDLRSPISTMKGLLKLCELDIQKNEKTDEYFKLMFKCLNKLDTRVSQLTEFSKNRNEFVKSELIDFRKLIHSVWENLSFHENYGHVHFSLSVSGHEVFYSDASRIELFFTHVIKNALDYCDLNKNERPFLMVVVTTSPTTCQIEILDNGQGIASTHLDKVFEMFYKASVQSQGAGLGLYLAREAMLKLDGSVTIESEYTQWTTVRVSIPNDVKAKLINQKRKLISRSNEAS